MPRRVEEYLIFEKKSKTFIQYKKKMTPSVSMTRGVLQVLFLLIGNVLLIQVAKSSAFPTSNIKLEDFQERLLQQKQEETVNFNKENFADCLVEIGHNVLNESDRFSSHDSRDYGSLMSKQPCVTAIMDQHHQSLNSSEISSEDSSSGNSSASSLANNRVGRQSASEMYCLFCPAEKPEDLYRNFAKCFTGSDPVCCSCILFASVNFALTVVSFMG
ncbi:unnamed protein product [Notodromas monacha]|uniref:Uncharacterized protein n=1 Tax=Notodromas monacha TaxID=399045 RepID=A0A7R9GFC6_9CRUS|nr:unnamed protein product [Notodromas monacha]CAG0920652.1 unnamed protein product [Notodromas monacha]